MDFPKSFRYLRKSSGFPIQQPIKFFRANDTFAMADKVCFLLCSLLTFSQIMTLLARRLNSTAYNLTFYTCDVPGADFDYPALVILTGEQGEQSAKLVVKATEGGFGQGSIVSVNVTANLNGPVCSVLLWRKTTNTGQGWKLEHLDILSDFGMTSFAINECDVEDDWVKETKTEYKCIEGINGQWGDWGPWSTGDVHSVIHRHRLCDNPPPMCGGEQCHGNSSQVKCSSPCGKPPPPVRGGQTQVRSPQDMCLALNCSTDMPILTNKEDLHGCFISSFITLLGVLISVTSLFVTILICYRCQRKQNTPVQESQEILLNDILPASGHDTEDDTPQIYSTKHSLNSTV